jgi:hypothetical protein
MKKTWALCALWCAVSAHAAPTIEYTDCTDMEKIETCMPKDSGDNPFLDVRQYPLSRRESLVTAQDDEWSGVYNPVYRVYLLDKEERSLTELSGSGGLMGIDVDIENLVIASFGKLRGIGDTGSIDFYRIDVESRKLHLFKLFKTDDFGLPEGRYADEKGKKDRPCGYIVRAQEFAHKNKYNLPFIEKLGLSDACL